MQPREDGSSDDCGGSSPNPCLRADGIGVGDLDQATAFVTDVLGMSEGRIGTVRQDRAKPATRPQHHNVPAYNHRGSPVKHGSYVPDVDAVVALIASAGGRLVQQPAPMPPYYGKLGAVL